MAVNTAPTCPTHLDTKLRTVPRRKNQAQYQYCPDCKRKFDSSVPESETKRTTNTVDKYRKTFDA